MNNIIDRISWWVFGIACTCIGVYPVIYFLIDRQFGLLRSKSEALLGDQYWNIGFYGHIVLGGVALLSGWSQFSPKLRRTRMNLHRGLGKIYLMAALLSGTCAIFIAQFSTGGLSNVIGFSLSGIIWVATTALAYRAIRRGQVDAHYRFMMYSYAVCFSAVTLRIWLPTLTNLLGDFLTAYRIVGWLSWVPNLLVAYLIIERNRRKQPARLAING
jgi:uncharacterized membrane protein